MATGLWLLAGAAMVKVASFGWLVSIATSPVAVESRRRFLEVNKQGFENLIKLGVGPVKSYRASLEQDFEILESNVETGWGKAHLFAAAYRVSAWKFWEHAYGALMGSYELAANAMGAATEGFGRWLDSLATPTPAPVDKKDDQPHI